MPTVSVIIPLYNARDVILQTLDTVLAQTWKEYEIVVVDDGSSDGSGALVQKREGIRYVRQVNAGVAKARNRGIAESKGRYVAFLDHDDLWHPTKLEKQVRVLEHSSQVGMVITDVVVIDRSGQPIGMTIPGYDPHDRFARLFVNGYVPTPSAALIRRSVLEAVGGFDESFDSAGLDDHEFWARIAQHCRIGHIPESLTYHRARTIKPPEIALRHRPILIAKLMQRFGDEPEKRRYLLREQAAYLCDLGKHLVKKGQAREGRAHLRQGLLLSLTEARTLKTAWRCISRITRSYF